MELFATILALEILGVAAILAIYWDITHQLGQRHLDHGCEKPWHHCPTTTHPEPGQTPPPWRNPR